MTGKDAPPVQPHRWKKRFSVLFLAIALAVICFAARHFWGPGSATAQSARSGPAARSAPASHPASVRPTPANGAQAAADPSTHVAAIVNGQRITRDDLAHECMRRFGKEVLETLINKHLIWQACHQKGISITQQDVEDEIDRMASRFGLSKDRWLALLESERDIAPDEYRREIIWPTLALRQLAAKEIVVTPDELQRAFESEYGPKVKVRMISVANETTAKEVHKMAAEKPERFEELAKRFSADVNSASAGGLIPPVRKHVGHEEVEKAVFALKEGEVSPVVHAANQYLIFKCEKHIPAVYLADQNLQPIESQLRDQIRDSKLRDSAGKLFQELQSKSQVVNVYNNAELRQQQPGVVATVNGRTITVQHLSDECYTRHGKEVIESEIHRIILTQALKQANKSVTEAAIDDEIARAAEAYGYIRDDGSPDIETWLKSITAEEDVTLDLYVQDAVWPSAALKMLVGDQVEVTQEDVKKGFEANFGERVDILAIVLSSQRQANSVWSMARDNPTDTFFGELAHEYSIEPISRANYGKVPAIRKHGGQPAVENEAFSMKPGDLSGIIAIGGKYIIMRCLGRTEPVVQDFSAVEAELRKDLHEKKLRLAMAERFDQLKAASQIQNNITGTSKKRSPPVARTAAAAAPEPTRR